MPEPKAYIELASKPLNPEVETLSDRRLRSVARWHAFAMREEARVWNEEAEMARQRPMEQREPLNAQGEKTVDTELSGDLRKHEPDTKQGTIEDHKQELASSDKTETIESHDQDRSSGDEECHQYHEIAESDSSAINDGESPEKKQAVFERADEHHGHIHTLEFNRVYAQKAEMPVLNHSAAAGWPGSHEDESVTAPHTPAPEANVEKTSGGDKSVERRGDEGAEYGVGVTGGSARQKKDKMGRKRAFGWMCLG
ncbi:hypothetical protein LTS02_007183 [Friedmanniomyces endolithicus]|nr:hypothetical protein LTS02_007183 [Friedmanniomyces endolithicus]